MFTRLIKRGLKFSSLYLPHKHLIMNFNPSLCIYHVNILSWILVLIFVLPHKHLTKDFSPSLCIYPSKHLIMNFLCPASAELDYAMNIHFYSHHDTTSYTTDPVSDQFPHHPARDMYMLEMLGNINALHWYTVCIVCVIMSNFILNRETCLLVHVQSNNIYSTYEGIMQAYIWVYHVINNKFKWNDDVSQVFQLSSSAAVWELSFTKYIRANDVCKV